MVIGGRFQGLRPKNRSPPMSRSNREYLRLGRRILSHPWRMTTHTDANAKAFAIMYSISSFVKLIARLFFMFGTDFLDKKMGHVKAFLGQCHADINGISVQIVADSDLFMAQILACFLEIRHRRLHLSAAEEKCAKWYGHRDYQS